MKNMTLVLKDTREVLNLVGLGNESVVIFKKTRLSRISINAIVIMSQISFLIASALFTLNNTSILSRINNPTHIIFGITLMTLIYLDLFRNKSFVAQKFNLLEKKVTPSEYQLTHIILIIHRWVNTF